MSGVENGVETSSLGRSLKVKAGEGMVTPAAPVTVRYRDGRRLLPRCHRFSPDHPLVLEAPDNIELCMKHGDRTDAPDRFHHALRAADRT
jgi:hypothetical protein